MPISNPSLPTVPLGLHVEGLALDASGLAITAKAVAAEAFCPVPGHVSARVHGRRWRRLQGLPGQGRGDMARPGAPLPLRPLPGAHLRRGRARPDRHQDAADRAAG